jgi:uncharacterized protein (DUF697 family)
VKTTRNLVPAWFIGSPVGFVLAGAGHRFMPVELALAGGALAAFAVGFAVLRALRNPAPQRY